MRSFILLSTAAALVAGNADVTETAPPMGVYKTKAWDPLVTAVTISEEPTATPTAAVFKRDAFCAAQPTGIPHVSTGSLGDTAAAFLADPFYPGKALGAGVPAGYKAIYTNSRASNNAENYMGYTLMDSYDVNLCAQKCDAIEGCASFNVYFERDPSVNPDSESCKNPPSVTNVKCVWWGGIIDGNTNVNSGQWRNAFEVVIAGSNAYANKAAAAIAATAVSSAPAAATTVANKAGSNYAIYFASDSTTGAFANAAASGSYQDCTTACDNTDSCKAFTYVGGENGVGSGTCWLKPSFGSPAKSGKNVVSGVKVAGSDVKVVSPSSSTTSSSLTTSASSTTLSTSIKPSTTQAPATTPAPTTSAAPSTSSKSTSTSSSKAPSSTLSAPFYIRVGEWADEASNKYAQISGTQITLIDAKNAQAATKFAYDNKGNLIELATGRNLAASVVGTDGAWRKLAFDVLGNKRVSYTNCSGEDMMICQANNAFQYAGTCGSDNWLYFGLSEKTPASCKWIGLYPELI